MADAACWLPYRLVFAGESRTWGGGGVAFVDVDVDVAERCRARRWLITLEQFADVVAQEGGRQPGEDLDLSPALVHGRMTVGASWYDLVVVADEIDGVPVVTLTTSRPLSLGPLAPNPPSAAYAETIMNGLEESHGLTRKEAARYVDLASAGAD